MTKTITEGNRAVIINQQESGRVFANLYVNVRGLAHASHGDITSTRWTGNTFAGAEKWAAKQLAA